MLHMHDVALVRIMALVPEVTIFYLYSPLQRLQKQYVLIAKSETLNGYPMRNWEFESGYCLKNRLSRYICRFTTL
jgi:hypothetical protein